VSLRVEKVKLNGKEKGGIGRGVTFNLESVGTQSVHSQFMHGWMDG